MWWRNTKGHNQASLKCKLGCSKYRIVLLAKDMKLNLHPVTGYTRISFIVFDSTRSHDHIAAAYTNYQRINGLSALWLKLTPL